MAGKSADGEDDPLGATKHALVRILTEAEEDGRQDGTLHASVSSLLAKLTRKAPEGLNEQLLAACASGNAAEASELLAAGASPNAVSGEGERVLLVAIQCKCRASGDSDGCTRRLLEAGAEASVGAKKSVAKSRGLDACPLYMAVKMARPASVKSLLEASASHDVVTGGGGFLVLSAAVRVAGLFNPYQGKGWCKDVINGWSACVKIFSPLLERSQLNELLFQSSFHDSRQSLWLCRHLLDARADPDAGDIKGYTGKKSELKFVRLTPLMNACMEGATQVSTTAPPPLEKPLEKYREAPRRPSKPPGLRACAC